MNFSSSSNSLNRFTFSIFSISIGALGEYVFGLSLPTSIHPLLARFSNTLYIFEYGTPANSLTWLAESVPCETSVKYDFASYSEHSK